MRFHSLRWRLLGITLVAVALSLLGAGWLLANLFRTHVTVQFEGQLKRRLDQLTAVLEPGTSERPRLKATMGDPRWEAPYSGLYWQIEAIDAPGAPGRVALRSRSLWDDALILPLETMEAGEVRRGLAAGPNRQRLMTLERRVQFVSAASHAAGPSWRLIVAGDTAELEVAVADFSRQLVLFLAVLGVALLLAAWAQVALGLLPLRKLQTGLQTVREGRARRLGGEFPAEIDPLVRDFNQVLDQNEQVIRRARQLAGNMAHAVKTPLAVISNLAQEQAGARAVWSAQLQEQVGTIRDQVDWHLGRARASSAGVAGLRTTVEPMLLGLARVMRKVHAERGLAVTVQVASDRLQFAGESQDLQEMVGNLLDNACKWARSHVRLTATLVAERLRIAVEDDGPGLSLAEREKVFERGVRADERVPGTGLGLDITRELAALYQGQVSLSVARLGGLRAELLLPGLPG